MNVLVAVDHKPSSQAIVDALVKMHWIDGTELNVITVRNSGSSPGGAGADEGDGLEEIEQLAVELRDTLRYCQVSFLAKEGDPARIILETAEKIDAHLIVIGSNCKNTLERLFLGSVSQTVLNQARCPVIVAKTPCCLARETSPGFRTILVPVDNSVYSEVVVHWLHNFDWAPECRFIVAAAVESDTNMAAAQKSLESRALELSRRLRTTNVFVDLDVSGGVKARISGGEFTNEGRTG